jgi:putative ABC transport system permease protein
MRYALRGLVNSPGFTIVAVLSLALGIGANTAIFSLFNAVVLKSLPVSHPEELVQIACSRFSRGPFTNPMWEHLRDRQDVFSGAFAWSHMGFTLTEGGDARQAHGRWVSGEFFTTLGVRAARGRTILPADDRRGCPAVAVLSDAFWQREYGGDPAVVGRNISLDGYSFAILGILGPGFTGVEVGDPGEIFAPFCSEAVIRGPASALDQRSQWWLYAMGRPKPGMTLEAVRTRLRMLAPDVMNATLPTNYSAEEERKYLQLSFDVRPMSGGLNPLRGYYQETLLILMTATGLVLLIACSNVANLLLARAAMQRQEVAVRVALGAGRGRIVRQKLTESLLLSFAGTALGALFALWAAKLLVGALYLSGNLVTLDLSPDWRVLAFTAAVAVCAALIFGLAPAWRAAGVPPIVAMKAGGRGATEGPAHLRLGKTLVALQIALSFVLLAGAGLLAGSFRNLATLDPGFHSEGLLLMELDFSTTRYSAAQRAATRSDILERLRQTPGVRSVSASYHTPIASGSWTADFITEGSAKDSDREFNAGFNSISDGYLETLGIALLGGRNFNRRDTANSPLVAIINETAAKQLFPGGNPLARALGKRLHLREGKKIGAAVEIVGIAQDAKYSDLRLPAPLTVYVPLSQNPDAHPSIGFQVRADGPASAVVTAAKSVMAEVDPRIPVVYSSLSQVVGLSLARERLLAALSSVFGGLALLLASIGLYGVLSHNVARRRNEIGIRMALGATQSRVLRMVLRESALLTAAGLIAGMLAALGAGRLVATLLYGLTPNDGPTLASAAAVLALVAMLAAYLPARRASTVDPMTALRDE